MPDPHLLERAQAIGRRAAVVAVAPLALACHRRRPGPSPADGGAPPRAAADADTAARTAAERLAARRPRGFLPPGTIVPPGQPVDATPAPHDPVRDGPLRPDPLAGENLAARPGFVQPPRDLASLALLQGTQYLLVRYAAHRLPARVASRGPRYPGARDCPAVVTSGSLMLDTAGGLFAFGYEVRNLCTAVLLGRALSTGRVTRRGRELVFRVQGPDAATFTGRRAAGGITLRPPADAVMRFRGRETAPPRPVVRP